MSLSNGRKVRYNSSVTLRLMERSQENWFASGFLDLYTKRTEDPQGHYKQRADVDEHLQFNDLQFFLPPDIYNLLNELRKISETW